MIISKLSIKIRAGPGVSSDFGFRLRNFKHPTPAYPWSDFKDSLSTHRRVFIAFHALLGSFRKFLREVICNSLDCIIHSFFFLLTHHCRHSARQRSQQLSVLQRKVELQHPRQNLSRTKWARMNSDNEEQSIMNWKRAKHFSRILRSENSILRTKFREVLYVHTILLNTPASHLTGGGTDGSRSYIGSQTSYPSSIPFFWKAKYHFIAGGVTLKPRELETKDTERLRKFLTLTYFDQNCQGSARFTTLILTMSHVSTFHCSQIAADGNKWSWTKLCTFWRFKIQALSSSDMTLLKPCMMSLSFSDRPCIESGAARLELCYQRCGNC